jgi:hypothetical protein
MISNGAVTGRNFSILKCVGRHVKIAKIINILKISSLNDNAIIERRRMLFVAQVKYLLMVAIKVDTASLDVVVEGSILIVLRQR